MSPTWIAKSAVSAAIAPATAIWVAVPLPESPQTKNRCVTPAPGNGAVRTKYVGPPATTPAERMV